MEHVKELQRLLVRHGSPSPTRQATLHGRVQVLVQVAQAQAAKGPAAPHKHAALIGKREGVRTAGADLDDLMTLQAQDLWTEINMGMGYGGPRSSSMRRSRAALLSVWQGYTGTPRLWCQRRGGH